MRAEDHPRVVEVLTALDHALPVLSRHERAMLVYRVTERTYRHVKECAPEGGGLDGRDGPERLALGKLCDLARVNEQEALLAHREELRADVRADLDAAVREGRLSQDEAERITRDW